jgi:hypothetical protein
MINYPYVCAAATSSSFSVSGYDQHHIQTVLTDPQQRTDLQKLIATLQAHEKEKTESHGSLASGRDPETNGGGDERIPSVARKQWPLRAKIEACVEQINDALLRFGTPW